MAKGDDESAEDHYDRPDPEDDPFACNICGGYMSSLKRLSESDICDACKREHAFSPSPPDPHRREKR